MTPDQAAPAHRCADELFDRYASSFGSDLNRYRGHVHRVIGLVGAQGTIPAEAASPLGLAAFFYDSAIWFDRT